MVIQQDWDGSMLRAYLLRDYWTLDGGLCILSGFDYTACIESAPYQPQWMHTLDPCTLQGHWGEDADKAEELLNRMNDDLDQLRIIWVGCKGDIEAEHYSPAFFIEWALSKNFNPDWLDWAIKNNLYASKKTDSSNGKDIAGTNSLKGTGNDGDDKPWLIHNSKDPVAKYTWYIPARYFARVLLKEDPLLIDKKSILADKVKNKLKQYKINKRGGIKEFDANTILKAFTNVNFG